MHTRPPLFGLMAALCVLLAIGTLAAFDRDQAPPSVLRDMPTSAGQA